jgi:hypothetical protein
MLDRSDPPEESAAPKPKRTWPLRGARRAGGKLKGGRKPNALTVGGSMSNVQILERLASLAATADECANFFQISGPTLNKRFRDHAALRRAWDTGRGAAAVSLRRNLFARAERNTADGQAAAFWLAKRMLIWAADDGDSGIIEPPPPEDARLQRLSPEEKATLAQLMEKARPR